MDKETNKEGSPLKYLYFLKYRESLIFWKLYKYHFDSLGLSGIALKYQSCSEYERTFLGGFKIQICDSSLILHYSIVIC